MHSRPCDTYDAEESGGVFRSTAFNVARSYEENILKGDVLSLSTSGFSDPGSFVT